MKKYEQKINIYMRYKDKRYIDRIIKKVDRKIDILHDKYTDLCKNR